MLASLVSKGNLTNKYEDHFPLGSSIVCDSPQKRNQQIRCSRRQAAHNGKSFALVVEIARNGIGNRRNRIGIASSLPHP